MPLDLQEFEAIHRNVPLPNIPLPAGPVTQPSAVQNFVATSAAQVSTLPMSTPLSAPINFPVYQDSVSIKLVEEYRAAQAAAKLVEELKPKLKALLGDAPKAMVGPFVLVMTPVKGNAGKLVTQDMVGTMIGGRAGYEKLEVK